MNPRLIMTRPRFQFELFRLVKITILNCDPVSLNCDPGHDSTLNCDPCQELSQLSTLNCHTGHISTLNSDPFTYLQVEL